MSKRVFATYLILFFFFGWMFSCYKPENETNISSSKEDESHKKGENCMNCHYREGPGEGWFSVAGSVYGNYTNASVNILDAESYDLIKRIEIDELGNLYTTENIDFQNGIRVEIINENGQVTNVMSTVVYTGQCNLCHDGQFENLIEIF
ncbi:hypothetical protein N9G63_01605 [Chitinophagales bacterium]|nr:hypothetical protein [Chitinophagales bacterium]